MIPHQKEDPSIIDAQEDENGAFTLPRTSTQVSLYYIWALLVCFLFVGESFGLNVLLTTTMTVPLYAFLDLENLRKPKWWLASLIFLLTAIGVFVHPTNTAITAWFVSFMYFFVVTNFSRFSLYIGLLQALIAVLNSYASFFEALSNFFRQKTEKKKRAYIRILQIIVPITLGMIFIKLYQRADKNFHDMTWFINLEWFSWRFVAWYLIAIFVLFGTYFGVTSSILKEWEQKCKDDVPKDHEDRIEKYLGEDNEARIASTTLILLNLILGLYVLMDFRYLFTGLTNPVTDPNLAEVVHDGIVALISSITLVILLVTFFLRGKLNFRNNKRVEWLTITWLVLNILLVFTTSVKNFEYISSWGLTYRRMGVYIYLFLCLVGLVIAIVKVRKKKTFWFLLRNTTLAFALVLASLLTFNWNRFITDYNLTNIEKEHIDFQYLVSLGPDTYAYIIHYHNNVSEVDDEILKQIADEAPKHLSNLSSKKATTTWKSYTINDAKLYEELSNLELDYKDRNFLWKLFN